MPYVVDFENVSTVGLESSPVADALAGMRANEARYFRNKYQHVFTVEPAAEAHDAVERVTRILADERSASDIDAPILVISQFTLYGDARKGRRPSWTAAAPGAVSEPLYDDFCAELAALGAHIERGVFGAHMQVASVNDGPVTLVLETP